LRIVASYQPMIVSGDAFGVRKRTMAIC